MSRSYPVPARIIKEAGEGPLADRVRATGSLDTEDIGRAALVASGALGEWAGQIIGTEQRALLNAFLGDSQVLPLGILAAGVEDDIVVGLAFDDRYYDTDGWHDGAPGEVELLDLDEATVADTFEALTEGADGLVLRPWIPVAVIAASAPAPAPATDTPSGAKVVAVVDELDKTAVIELIAIAPGPKVWRRNDGAWTEDTDWVTTLRSVRPPPLVSLTDPAQISDVVRQVDEATKGMPFDPKADKTPPVAASAWAAEHQRKADDFAVRLALVAASKGQSKLANKIEGHVTGAERLAKYWTAGPGAVKIRWGTPGSWRRCFRHLSKYVGPRAAGLCTNYGKRLGGKGVAWDVGGKAKRAAKKVAK